jgi:hypothetical protein
MVPTIAVSLTRLVTLNAVAISCADSITSTEAFFTRRSIGGDA